MLVLYRRDFALVDYEGKEVVLSWITARRDDMLVPGGVLARGRVLWFEEHADYEPFGSFPPAEQTALSVFALMLWFADQRAREIYNDTVEQTDLLDCIKPVLQRIYGEDDGVGALFVFAFREGEAARAARRHGLRSRGQTGGNHLTWSALDAVHGDEVLQIAEVGKPDQTPSDWYAIDYTARRSYGYEDVCEIFTVSSEEEATKKGENAAGAPRISRVSVTRLTIPERDYVLRAQARRGYDHWSPRDQIMGRPPSQLHRVYPKGGAR